MYNKKVLFLTEKWCDANPSLGLTSHYHNLFTSLQSTGYASEIDIFHFDELMMTQEKHIDELIEDILEISNPDVVIVSQIGDWPINPTLTSYNIIKNKGIKLVMTWADTLNWTIFDINNTYNLADLNISWGQEHNTPLNNKHMFLWAPQDPNLYFDDKKIIDVSFVGTPKPQRAHYISYLRNNNIEINSSGGQRANNLTAEEYARQIRISKINLNTSEGLPIPQMKGRVLEVLASNSLLIEDNNPATAMKFKPGEHYIQFNNEADLKDKIQYFLKNEKERIDIAKNGYDYYLNNYTAKHYWNIVFEKIFF